MAKTNKLEEVVNAGQKYNLVSNISEMRSDITNPQLYVAIQGYLLGQEKLSPAEIEQYVNSDNSGAWQKNPSLLGERILEHEAKDKNDLVKKVQDNFEAIIDKLDKDELGRLALTLPDKNKKYIAIQQAIAEGDTKTARGAYLETFESEDWKRTIASKTESELRDFAVKYTEIMQSKFIQKYLSTDGKYDAAKAKAYVKTLINSYKPEEKEKILITLGLDYASKNSRKK